MVNYLHTLRNLKVLVLKGCPVQTVPNYRVRLLAFVPTLRFLDGKSVKPSEVASAKDGQRENLLTVDEEDEKRQILEKEQLQMDITQKDYIRYNCPNEQRFCEELFKLTPDKYTLYELLRCDALISASKEPLDRFQTEFNEKLTELAERMKTIRLKRDSDDEKYATAKATYTNGNVEESLQLMKQFEAEVNKYVPSGITAPGGTTTSADAKLSLFKKADQLQSNLMELEANQIEVFSGLQNVTVSKWKSDGVDVLIQSSFESLLKTESDFQVAVRQIFDTYYEQRKKRNVEADTYYTSKQEENIRVLLESREEYQKYLGDVFEMRRKRLEDSELFHLAAEEKLLTERSRAMSEEERTRHRSRIIEIDTYIQSIKKRLT
ncbi:U2 small nuclear ribonucleoprotein A' [Strigomonas culicis]|nr:U2 small nuclear ribonucleoprotein A' [Strigomonas culicis]|eukprot:EPY29652.1 U2 small nuclear ribonucleoprotein A' [Strigomonas culicis]